MSGKRKSTSATTDVKKPRHSISLEDKMEVICRMEGGEGRPSVCSAMNLPPSTVEFASVDNHEQCGQNNKKFAANYQSKCYTCELLKK